MRFNEHTKKLFLAIFNGDLPEVQRLIGNIQTDLTFILPNMYIRSSFQLKILNLFKAFGNYNLKKKLSTNNPLLFALSLQRLEIAEVLLNNLIYNFREVKLQSIKKQKIINSLNYVNSFGMSAVHLLCGCDVNCDQTLMCSILTKLASANIDFIPTVLKGNEPIFSCCFYNSKHNFFYKQVLYEILKYNNSYEVLLKNSQQDYLLLVDSLMKNDNIELLLWFSEQYKDFFNKELILEAIKLCNQNALQQIISFNQLLSIYLINKNFNECFNVLINSVDQSLINNVYVAIIDITAKMTLVFQLATLESAHMIKSIEDLYKAIKHYVRYRQQPIKAINFIPWLRILKDKINTLTIKVDDIIIINKYLENINRLLFGVSLSLLTVHSEPSPSVRPLSFRLPPVDSNYLFFTQSQSNANPLSYDIQAAQVQSTVSEYSSDSRLSAISPWAPCV